ncbi:uncharacterized protein [Physcomitrium patens]|uniref:Uncharacterized protein n=1 Tax=Physcomitrium patens TaxID=3218 RepID=A0A2K1IQQ7_PHYPA|nr:uncharacterized protein LOC112274502 [Physcomitrium patens]XP_024359844.1 uncharacterized protein LOC112274502 [Physcomitrium patens]PNR31598.1 hypothetical protein PHYPA_025719 [Physcomitrium patens]|eukprot:XP_024359843.1 uncharacterized protein LOC112274502 [Physcomitrella patens]
MNLTRFSNLTGEGLGVCNPYCRTSQTTGVKGRLCRGLQGNDYFKTFPLRAGVSFQSLVCTTFSRTISQLRSRSLQQQSQSYSSTSLSRGLYLKSKRGLIFPHASGSDDSTDDRPLNSDDDDDQSRRDSSSLIVEDSLSVSGEVPGAQYGGKPGFVSFCSAGSGKEQPESTEYQELKPSQRGSLLWLFGPLALVFSVVGPPLYLRRVFESILEDSLLTDFVILFCTEALFYVGVSLFLYISHKQQLLQASSSAKAYGGSHSTSSRPPVGYRVSMIISVALGVVLPAISFGVVWPWTGPAAAAALLPYLLGLGVQLGFEKFVIARKSPVWTLVPVTFQVYRLHQLNRAAQLVAGLLFSLKAVEATPETLAINGSLQSILSVVQMLGILCLWSLGSFLMHNFPARPSLGDDAISVP